jgi:hypothetical protein
VLVSAEGVNLPVLGDGDMSGILDSDLVALVTFGRRVRGLGVVSMEGLKLWPVRCSLTTTLEFHRGLPSVEVSEVRDKRFAAGVVTSRLKADGEDLLAGPPYVDNRPAGPPRTAGALAVRFWPGLGKWLSVEVRTLRLFKGVEGSSSLLNPVITTEDAGELPGVSFRLAIVDRSFDTRLEMESLNC